MGNVTTGMPKVSGGVYRAPLGTTLPTDATTALSSDFVSIGYITEDGVGVSNNLSKDVIKAWGGDVVMTKKTGSGYTVSYNCMEHLNEEVQKISYGDSNVTTTSALTTIDATGEVGDAAVYVIERITSDGKADRIVIPNAEISAIGEVKFVDTDAITYPVTMTLLKDTIGTKKMYFREYIEA